MPGGIPTPESQSGRMCCWDKLTRLAKLGKAEQGELAGMAVASLSRWNRLDQLTPLREM
ncbi:hypothetical protein Q31a_55410 [Aureliella helgolandensis]|uniref:Uncharacterized protein n=1 Tax=Aureliella helgolandensis TaxID=2527968 RepID=A0A518GEX8_9BACT|nr:hypothetical protein Q31a_55410 [Aureliella helgolandensis]